MIIRPHLRSFAAGEITPELFGRIDLVQFQTGLARCYNFWTLPHGPAQNRNGFAFVNETKNSLQRSVLIPFSYSTVQTFVLEVGDQYIRFHTNGGTLAETPKSITAITKANPGVVTITGHGFTNGQWVYLSGIGGMAQLNGRFVRVGTTTANTFQLNTLAGAALDTTDYDAYTSSGTAARVYEIASPYLEEHLHELHFTQSEDVLTITHQEYGVRELRRQGPTDWALATVSFVPTIGTPGAPTVTASTGSGSTTYSYKTTALAEDSLEESLPSPEASTTNDLTTGSNRNSITPAAVTGAVRYNIYKLFNGLYGYIGQTDGGAFFDNNVTPDVSKTPAVVSNPFTGAENPAAVGYYESRRGFGGTPGKPQNYWLTRSATESNLSYSIPTRDDDTIQGRVRGSEVNAIRHIVAVNEALVFLTSGGPWRLAPSNSDILTPTSALPKQISGEGASMVPPAFTADEVVYVSESGRSLFAIKYQWEANGLITDDLTLMAPHLFEGYVQERITYAKVHKTIWSVRDDGILIGVTYLPRQKVNGMHQHETQGAFESVCSVREGLDSPVYAIIERLLDGRTVRTIERMSQMRPKVEEDAFHVDCGVTYKGAATASLGGLWHLVGEEVTILADGGVGTAQVVSDEGTITLETPAETIHVGLAYVAELETLPLVMEGVAAAGQASFKNVSEVRLRVRDTSTLRVGTNFTKMRDLPARSNENYDTAPARKNGVVSVTVDPNWDNDARLCIQQRDPLPVTIASMTLMVASND